MIVGHVNRNREAIIAITIRDANGDDHVADAVIDTGFNGSLTLPASVAATLDLDWRGREQGTLSDGRVGYFDIYAARIVWNDHERFVETAIAEGAPLVGMSLLDRHELRINVVSGGEVTISSLDE